MRSAIKTAVIVLAASLLAATAADARVVSSPAPSVEAGAPIVIAQRGCMSLSQAIDSIRRSGNVERVISAETRGKTHYIKVLTKDGKVRTHQVPAC